MLIVAGLSLRNLVPRVWDKESDFYLPDLRAVMVSYAEFHASELQRARAVSKGLRKFLGVPSGVNIYLDNGAFYFARTGTDTDYAAYRKFVREVKPDWYPIPFDAIPTPQMSRAKQRECFDITMAVNVSHHHDGYVPVVHVGGQLNNYIDAVLRGSAVKKKPRLALGGMVPNLLRSPKAASYETIVDSLSSVRTKFPKKDLHVFGIGGTATVHLAMLLGFSSADSSGWRNRAARGIVQLPGHGDRVVANLGSWRGRVPSRAEWRMLKECRCPGCAADGVKGLRADGIAGFSNRATHNLHVLLDEAKWVKDRLDHGTYKSYFRKRLNNSTYLPLLEHLVESLDD